MTCVKASGRLKGLIVVLLLAGWPVEAPAQSPCGGHIQILSVDQRPPIAVIETLSNGSKISECGITGEIMGQDSSADTNQCNKYLTSRRSWAILHG